YDFVRPGQDPTWLDEQFHPPANDQFYFNSYVPGEFRIPCIAELAAHPTEQDRLYLVFCDRYADEIGQPGSEDGDMDIYVMRSTDGGQTWSPRVRVNQDRLYDPGDPDWDDHVLYDQFMPQIAVDASDRVHVIWYDTRLDHLAANDTADFRIEMYYAWAFDDGEDPLDFTEDSLDVAIKTENLSDEDFIGDYNSLLTTGNRVLPLYMGTQHLQSIPGGGQRGPTQRDEAIFVNRIFW
ncbi:MAG: glycoside hydrolase, partial [Planctomycetes bacterium]|nr:glycoside hydrolase [Planctomycetota bacterium]